MFQKSFRVIYFFLIIALFSPQVAMATPLTGANTDVTQYWHNGMMGWTNDTTDANDSGQSGDTEWPESSTKIAYIGHSVQFSSVYVDVSQAAFQSGFSLVMQYWNGSSWAALTISAQTYPFDSTGVNNFSFSIPGDWVANTVNGVEMYYIKTTGSSGSESTSGAQVSQISLIVPSGGGGGGGGGAAVPEFTDFIYFSTLLGALYFVGKILLPKYSSALLSFLQIGFKGTGKQRYEI